MAKLAAAITWWSLCLLVGNNPMPWTTALSSSSTTTTTAGKNKWKPKVASVGERHKLRRGLKHDSEKIGSLGFHHVEFYCGDAKSTAHRFSLALGMPIIGTTGQHTGNDQCVSYGLQSGNVRFLLTAPYSTAMASAGSTTSTTTTTTKTTNNDDNIISKVPDEAPLPLPQFSPSAAHDFFAKHGLAARAIGLRVKDAKAAFEASVASGAKPVLEPTFVATCPGQTKKGQTSEGCFMAEVELYGDVVLRYLSFLAADDDDLDKVSPNMPFLPHLFPVEGKISERETFGIYTIDHAVGNVPDLYEAYNRIKTFTGFHEFAEFTSEDVGTVDSGLNSVVLASDKEHVLMPLNEPTEGRYVKNGTRWYEQVNVDDSHTITTLQTKISNTDLFGTKRRAGSAAPCLENQRYLQND